MQGQPTASPQAAGVPMQEAMLEEARSNELKLAYLRSVGAFVFAAIQLSIYLMPHLAGLTNYPLTDTLLAGIWSIGALGLLMALQRGWYHSALRLVVPFVDAVTIAAAFLLMWYHLDFWGDMVPSGVVVSVTGLCVFLAFSGALRLSRASAALTTVLGLCIFLFMALVTGHHPAYIAISATTIVITGLLGMRVAGIIRRIVSAEVHRAEVDQRFQAAQLAVNARDEILKIVSHDLRNPLNTIFMGADSLLETIPEDESLKMERRYVEIIRRASARMNHLVQDLLNVSNVESGTLSLHRRVVDVHPLVEEAVTMLASAAAEAHLTLTSELPSQLPPVDADPDRLLQILSNLIGNAMKFTPAGGHISIQAAEDEGFVRMSVVDTGPGIPAEQLPNIFRKFWQADAGDRRGIGFGLSIVQGLVEAHGGRVWVESEVGIGSAFHFTVPAIADTNESRPFNETAHAFGSESALD